MGDFAKSCRDAAATGHNQGQAARVNRITTPQEADFRRPARAVYGSTPSLMAKEKTLYVCNECGGSSAIGCALLKREPTLDVHAMDRSAEMQAVGQQNARALGFTIKSTIGDVHVLPFPDNHFDVVTLQFASRHLRVREVFSEILRVLKPGGHFHHSDMLRPRNPIVKNLYFGYLKACLNFTSLIVGSSPAATRFKQYFIDALDLFYTAEELSIVLRELGFVQVSVDKVFHGMIGFHRAVKPEPKA